MNVEIYMSEGETAKLLGLSRRTLQRFRTEGNGPAFLRLATRRVIYARSDIESWTKRCRQGGMAAFGGEGA
jgi:predicted DNA-binding transcriptional regulator AlpA